MVDDFRPQQSQEPGQPNDKQDNFQAAYDDKPETFVTPTGEPTTLETPQQMAPLTMPKKKGGAGKWLLGGLVVLLLAGLGAFAYWQWAEAENAKQELTSTKTALQAAQDAAKKQDAKTESDASIAAKGEDFKTFIAEYDKMAAASVSLTDADKKAIETAVKDHYKLATLPTGWQIVIAYKDAKADATTGKPVNALVYWPASSEKPAGFFEVTQAADGKWAYNEQR
jgi:uncharacterized protein HemX